MTNVSDERIDWYDGSRRLPKDPALIALVPFVDGSPVGVGQVTGLILDWVAERDKDIFKIFE